MRFRLLFAIAVGFMCPFDLCAETITEVVVAGGASPLALITRAGGAYDASAIERDVRALHATGRFTDVRVESEPIADGTRVTFQLVPDATSRAPESRDRP